VIELSEPFILCLTILVLIGAAVLAILVLVIPAILDYLKKKARDELRAEQKRQRHEAFEEFAQKAQYADFTKDVMSGRETFNSEKRGK
jgi:Tfp pilus assembly protein PilE